MYLGTGGSFYIFVLMSKSSQIEPAGGTSMGMMHSKYSHLENIRNENISNKQ
jgi:hypothetical protein